MARTPDLVSIKLQELMLLLTYRWAAVNSPILGELGTENHEGILNDIDRQSSVQLTPSQLADLIYHMKMAILDKTEPARLRFTTKNYNKIMRKLKSQVPNLFKELKSGEVVMVELEEKVIHES